MVIAAAPFSGIAESLSSSQALRLILPAQAVSNTVQVRLSSIAALEGPKSLTDKAGGLILGTFVSKGQVISVDRNTILSRLASVGINASCVELSGAEKIEIKRKEALVDSETIAQTAKVYLESQLANQKIASLSLFRQPTPMILDDPNALPGLTCRMSRYQTAGSTKVEVAASQNGLECGRSEVLFTVRYRVRQATAIRDIESGEMATSDNVQMQEVETFLPNQKDHPEPYGMLARRKITQGAMIHPDSFVPRQAPVIIRRNQQVLVKIDTGGLFLSAPGQALDDGRIGEIIRVRRGQRPDEVTIYATVQPDGTVQPQL